MKTNQFFAFLFPKLLFFSLFFTTFLSPTFGNKTLDVPKTTTEPIIDGMKDEMWNTVPSTFFTTITNETDFSGDFRIAWDINNLYIFVTIKDDMVNTSHESYWLNDNLQIWLDGGNEKADLFDDNDVCIDYVYGDKFLIDAFNYTTEGLFSKENFGNCSFASFKTELGYNYEIALNGDDLLNNLGFELIKGAEMGLFISPSDNDDGEREWAIQWPGYVNNFWTIPSTWGTIILTDDNGGNDDDEPENPCGAYNDTYKWTGTTSAGKPISFFVTPDHTIACMNVDMKITYVNTCTWTFTNEKEHPFANDTFNITIDAYPGVGNTVCPRVKGQFTSNTTCSGEITESKVAMHTCGGVSFGTEKTISKQTFTATGIFPAFVSSVSDAYKQSRYHVVIFPNSGAFSIEIHWEQADSRDFLCQISNFEGKVIKQQKNSQNRSNVEYVNIENLKRGIYFITIIEEGKIVHIQKFITK